MPQIYTPHAYRRRRRSSSSSSSSSAASTGPELIDADDTIVLSDLLRTGEASRLRRRGAMRIDPTTFSQNTSPDHILVHDVVVVDRIPQWDTEYDFDLAHHMPPRRRQRSTRRYGPYESGSFALPSAQPEGSSEDYVYSLVCGARIPDFEVSDDMEPFKPSILPLYPDHADRHGKDRQKDVNRSSGCGSLVHIRAAPRPRSGVWTALGSASSNVVSLDASYFETREAAKISRSSCGCVREGIGCAVCGNPLGIRYLPCKSAADSFFSSAHADKFLTQGSSSNSGPSSRLRGPEGPAYWDPAFTPPSRGSHRDQRTIYTFFATTVTPTPSYTFPPQKSRADPTSSSGRPRLYSNASASSDLSLEIISSPVLPPTRGFVVEDGATEYISEDDIDIEEPFEVWVPPQPRPLDRHLLSVQPRDDSASAAAETIADRGLMTSPIPLSDIGEENSPRTRPAVLPPLPPQLPRPHWRAPVRRPVIYPPPFSASSSSSSTSSSPVSFYQQQVLGAWEREREREREGQGRTDGYRTDAGFVDPDGENFVWGSEFIDPDGAGVGGPGPAGSFDEVDKSQECLVFPER